jgi:hypothetical protein
LSDAGEEARTAVTEGDAGAKHGAPGADAAERPAGSLTPAPERAKPGTAPSRATREGAATQAAAPGWAARAGSLLRRNWLFAAVLAGAAALRAVVMLGYPPVMWFNDSYRYVSDAIHLSTNASRPSGYPFFLRLLLPFHSFTLVAALQHLMGLAIGVGIYALLRRRGLPAWGATLAAVPVLFDAYQVQVEQQVMSDALFMLLVTGAVVLLCWNDRVSVPVAVISGVAIGYATVVRSVGLPLLVVVAVCLLIRRIGWRPLVALVVAGAIPIAGYMLVYYLQHGRLATADSAGTYLYGRVQSFANCAVMKPPASLVPLCDPRPPAARPIAVEYIWSPTDPLWKFHKGLFNPRVNALAQQFADRAIEDQPLSYLRVVAADTWRAFGWNHNVNYDRQTDVLYLFSEPPPQIPSFADWKALRAFQPGLGQTRAVRPFAGFLGAYQRWVYLHGTLLGLMLLAGLAGLVARWRRWGGLVLLPWAVAVVLLVLPMATSGFSYRYTLAVTPLASIAAGLAFARTDGSREQDRRGRRRGDGAAGGTRAVPEGSDHGETAASPITRAGDVRYGGSAGGGANT